MSEVLMLPGRLTTTLGLTIPERVKISLTICGVFLSDGLSNPIIYIVKFGELCWCDINQSCFSLINIINNIFTICNAAGDLITNKTKMAVTRPYLTWLLQIIFLRHARRLSIYREKGCITWFAYTGIASSRIKFSSGSEVKILLIILFKLD